MYKFLPDDDQGGVTTAVNAVVGATSTPLELPGGPQVMISVGANPIFIRFGISQSTGAVTSSNGMRLGPNTTTVLSKPTNATALFHIRDGASDSSISVQAGISGT